ncbi:MAG: S8 family serine peptidase [Rhizobacter sp.]|nr:S8 family serine peptidase [Chlorobiales bacterium]
MAAHLRRIFIFLVILFICLADATAQTRRGFQQPNPRLDASPLKAVPDELIIKFKATASATMLSLFQGASQSKASIGQVQMGEAEIKPLYSKILIARKGLSAEASQAVLSRGLDKIFTIRLRGKTEAELSKIIKDLEASGEAEYVQRNNLYRLAESTPVKIKSALHDASDEPAANDSAFASQWNLQSVRATEAWTITKGDPAVRIGIIDTGIDYTHPDLISKLFVNAAEDLNKNNMFEPWPSSEKRNPKTFELDPNGTTGDFDGIDQDGNGYADDVIGWDFTDQPFNQDALNGQSDFQTPDADPFDDNSHGTACAGIAAAATNNSIGIAGVAPDCKLVTLRAFTGAGYADDKDLASALIYAAENNVRVVNMSFGDVVVSPVMRDAVAYAYSRGVVLVASAGNAGGDDPHFPSGYEEVISVVATTGFDELTTFSTFGITVDLGAPGEGIAATYPFYRNFYTNTFGGTSAAAPHVAAAAALVLSLHPDYTPEQVRGVLVSTTDDIDLAGYDHYTAHGRLNIEKALQSTGSPVAKILMPVYDGGISTNVPVSIIGTATSPVFKSYQLDFKAGTEAGGNWIAIQPETFRQRISDTLGTWAVSSLPDSFYTVRLKVNEENGRTVESLVRYFLDRTAPVISNLSVDSTIITNESRGVLIECVTDDAAELTLYYRPKFSTNAYSQFRCAGITRTHFQLLRSSDMQAGMGYEAYLQAKNQSGLISNSNSFTFEIDASVIATPTFGQNSFRERTELQLPKGYLLNAAFDFNANGRREVIMNQSKPEQGLKYGPLKRLEFDGAKFITLDSINQSFIPRSAGDLNGDGKPDLLSQSSGRTILFSQSSATSSPFASILFADTVSFQFWGSRLAATKDTGIAAERQIIARNDTAYFITDKNFNRLATLPNPVLRAKDGSKPAFEEPKSAVADFDGDGKPEILVGDYDANFYIYEYSGGGNTYTQTWLERTKFISGSNSVVSGKFLGNGKTQFIIGAHASLSLNSAREYNAPVWHFECWEASGDNTYRKLWEQNFYNYRPAFFFESATSAGDLDKDGKDDLVICAYPNLYIFKWDAVRQTFAPMLAVPNTGTSETLIADIDGNGLNELYFADDLQTHAFETTTYTGLLAPTGIGIEPLGEAKLKLTWQRVQGATGYKIFRDKNLFPVYPTTLLTTTSNTEFTDDVVSADASGNQQIYTYAVLATNSASTSDTSAYLVGVPHSLPKLTGATYQSKQLSLRFSVPLRDAPLNAGSFVISKEGSGVSVVPPSVVLAKGGAEAVMSFATMPLDTGRYSVRVQNVRDIYNAAMDTLSNTLLFDVLLQASNEFYIASKKLLSSRQFELVFNKPVDATSAQMLSNYNVLPDGRISAVMIDNAQNKLTLTVEGRPLGATGVKVSVVVNGVKSTDGASINTESGNVVSFSGVNEDLSQAFTYPNPYRKSAGTATGTDGVMFAGLTRRGTIQIFTLTGKAVKRIDYDSESGGAKWMLNTETDEPVATGIYLYRITAAGVPEKIGKLAVVR